MINEPSMRFKRNFAINLMKCEKDGGEYTKAKACDVQNYKKNILILGKH